MKTDLERAELTKEKTGVKLEGVSAVNPVNGQEIPIFVADYVLSGYGTGAIMAVPAHDVRDHEFAKKYGLPITKVVEADNKNERDGEEKQIVGVGALIRSESGKFIFQLRDANTNRFPGMIAPFGGGILEAELPINALKRELSEELNITTEDGEVSLIGNFESHFDRGKFIRMYYVARFETNGLKMTEGAETVELSLAEALENKKVTNFTKEVIRIFFGDSEAYAGEGVSVNSGFLDGLATVQAKKRMIEWLEEKKIGRRAINYRIRDWLISRQRYWGAPIPIIYCVKCGIVPVPESDLPVVLPTDVDFKPTGESPLVHSAKFQDVKCPHCDEPARREADTMDTFVCSSWYYLRYADPDNDRAFADPKQLAKWLPVDLYVGGAEHTVLHLLYSRFFTKALQKYGYLDFNEPFLKLRHQGTILAPDGQKMSKSKGNVINPDEVVAEYGADALRLYEMFLGPLEDAKPWNTASIAGVSRFLEKSWKVVLSDNFGFKGDHLPNNDEAIYRLINRAIKKVGEDIESMKFNTAISEMMKILNDLKEVMISHSVTPAAEDTFKKYFLIILSPFAPHIAEELWFRLGESESIFKKSWPEYDEKYLRVESVNLVVQVNGKLRHNLVVASEIEEEDAKKLALESDSVKKWLAGKEIAKIIFVSGKLINIVTK